MMLTIIGGGMAGCEAAWQAAERGMSVHLYEMRPTLKTDAHTTDKLAELVCSNSFRSDDHTSNAVGLLHEEMRRAGSLIMSTADEHKLPAGGALAVDRDHFSDAITQKIEAHPNITLIRKELADIPDTPTIIATGPLTSGALADQIAQLTNIDSLAFFDAIAPIVYADSVDMSKAWFQSRYDKGETEAERTAYLNCPMSESEYHAFIDALLDSPTTDFKEWEKNTPYFNGCLPIEVMAERGRETLRFGPMKPVGLTNPHQPEVKPYAVVQLRHENAYGTLFNIVGFQTKLKYGAQGDVLRLIPGLENARFARLGGMHRNTFLNSPKLLDTHLRLKTARHIQFAGQITGVEGYVESAAIGLLAGQFAAGRTDLPPPTTAHGALLNHVTGGANAETFQPMNINFGLFPPCDVPKVKGKKSSRKAARAQTYCTQALTDFSQWTHTATS